MSETISRITDKVIERLNDWAVRPLDEVNTMRTRGEQMSYGGLLAEPRMAESDDRARRRRRIKAAGISGDKPLRT